MSEAGEATLTKAAASVSPQAAERSVVLERQRFSRALVTSNHSGVAIPEATAAASVQGKVVAKSVLSYIQWFNVKKGLM